MDHSVKAMNSHRKLAFSRLLNRHRFENDELESLYQRYIFKLQHSSVASVVALFVILTGILANLSLAYAQAPTAQNIYHSLHCLLFALLLAFLNTRLMQDAYLLWVCYAILFFCTTFCAVAMPLGKCSFPSCIYVRPRSDAAYLRLHSLRTWILLTITAIQITGCGGLWACAV